MRYSRSLASSALQAQRRQKQSLLEHRQRQRHLLVGVEALRLGPDKTFLAQQLPDLAARFAGDDRQVQVLALQQLLGGVAVHFDLDQRIGLGAKRDRMPGRKRMT